MFRAHLLLFLPAFAACANGLELRQGVVRGAGSAFRLGAIPAAWSPIEVSDGALGFRDDARGATVGVTARCHRDGDDVPLRALREHLFIQFTDRTLETEEKVMLDGREALHTVLVAKLDGVAKKFDSWIVKKDECVYDMVYVARPDTFEAGVSDFRGMVSGFSVLNEGREP